MATKVVREKVVAFRLTDDQMEEVVKKLKAAGIAGAAAPGLMARKLILDWFDDAITWKNKTRQKMSPEAFKAHLELSKRA